MSDRTYTRFPGLAALARANGINYLTANMRATRGWPIEFAGSIPVGQKCPSGFVKKRPGKKPRAPLPEPVRKFLWERPEWERAAVERAMVPKRILVPRDPMIRRPATAMRKRYVPRNIAEDNAPLHIQRIRTAYCNHFIKTGVLDEALGAQLRTYADEQRASAKHSARVSPEHETRHYSQEATRAGDDGGGVADQIDGGTADRIRSFLRST